VVCIAVGTVGVIMKEYLFAACTIIIGLAALSARFIPANFVPRNYFFVTWFATGLVVASFFLGLQNARWHLLAGMWATHIITMSGQTDDLRVRLIRSGDRGLLFFDPSTKMINFVKWSDVKRIQSLCNC